MSVELRSALNHALCDELSAALDRIVHCFGQLTDEQIWSRSRADMNSIGNLVLHLAGNVKQLIVSGVGDVPDDRDRPAEFAARDMIPAGELLGRLSQAVEKAQDAIRTASPEALLGPVKVKKYDWTGMQAVVRSIAHFRGHTQEIIHMTRERLGANYEFAGPR